MSPPLSPPCPPMAVSRQGCREGSRERLPSLHPCLLTAIPICPPGGRPMRLSRTHGGRGRTLQRPHPPWPRHSRVGLLLWLDMCENNIIGRADNHYFRKISFFAMARYSLLGSCYGSLRPCALLLPRKKASRPRPHFAAAAPLTLFRGAAGRSPPPTQTIPPLARCSLLVSCYGSVRKRPVLLPQTAKGGLVLVRKRPFPSPPSAVWGAGRCVPSAPPSGGGRGQAGARPQAAVHQPAPFRRRCPCSPPRGASLLICFFHLNRCSLLFSCYGSMQEISFMAAIAF